MAVLVPGREVTTCLTRSLFCLQRPSKRGPDLRTVMSPPSSRVHPVAETAVAPVRRTIAVRPGRIGGAYRVAVGRPAPRPIAVRRRRPARRSFMSATKEVVIIGAGPGGLASAMLLASAGFRVKVLERRDRVGGRTSAIEGGWLPLRSGSHVLPLSARTRSHLSRGRPRLPPGGGARPAGSAVPPDLRRRRRVEGRPATWSGCNGRSPRSRRAMRPSSPVSWPRTG